MCGVGTRDRGEVAPGQHIFPAHYAPLPVRMSTVNKSLRGQNLVITWGPEVAVLVAALQVLPLVC